MRNNIILIIDPTNQIKSGNTPPLRMETGSGLVTNAICQCYLLIQSHMYMYWSQSAQNCINIAEWRREREWRKFALQTTIRILIVTFFLLICLLLNYYYCFVLITTKKICFSPSEPLYLHIVWFLFISQSLLLITYVNHWVTQISIFNNTELKKNQFLEKQRIWTY